MFPPLIATKLSFPQVQRAIVSRPRLIERVNAGLQGPLTLVSAPAGYGKSTLLSEWRSQPGNDAALAWLTLDAEDNDRPRFLYYLAAALESVSPGLARDAISLLQSPQPPPTEYILTVLINNTAALDHPLVLALDDYYLIDNSAVHEATTFLLAHLPATLHMVILTREDPPLPLPKLRVRGELTEIRESDLRFSVEEAASYLSQAMGLSLSDMAIAMLADRTEGWIAGLQMAALALRTELTQNNLNTADGFIAAFGGDDRYIMDYLMEEVFRRQPMGIQNFLLCTAVSDRLCASLCDALISDEEKGFQAGNPATESQSILEQLERANMFLLPLDNRREWYRYHHLFADLLRYRLKHERPEHIPDLHRRASMWFMQAGYPDEAMKHALAAPDYRLAADVAEQYMIQMTGSSRLNAYLSWLGHIPAEEIRGRAYLCAGCGWAYVLTYQVEQAEKYLAAGEAALPHYLPVYSQPDHHWISGEEVQGNLEAIRSYAALRRGDSESAIQHAQKALEILPEDAAVIRCAVALNLGMLYYETRDLGKAHQALMEAFETAKLSNGNLYVGTSALRILGVIAALQGKLNEAAGFFHRSIQFGLDNSGLGASIPSVGVTHLWLVELHYQRNEMDAAREHLNAALRTGGQIGVPNADIRACLQEALLALYQNDLPSGEDWLGRAEELMHSHPVAQETQIEWASTRCQLYTLQGDFASAESLLDSQGVHSADLENEDQKSQALRTRLPLYLLLVRLHFAQGEIERATHLMDKLSTMVEIAPEFPLFLELLALKSAHASSQKAGSTQSLSTLERALDIAAPEGYVQPFIKAGYPLVSPLRQAIARGIQPSFAGKILSELDSQERQRQRAGISPQKAGAGEGMTEPLTDRETQVLRLLAAGLSSNEIAHELFLAVSTTRSYIKILYQKLDAHSREQAIEKGRQLRLI